MWKIIVSLILVIGEQSFKIMFLHKFPMVSPHGKVGKTIVKDRWVFMSKPTHLLLSLIIGWFWLSRKTNICCNPNQVTSLKYLSDLYFYVKFLMKNRIKNKVELGHFNLWMSENVNLDKSCLEWNTWLVRSYAKIVNSQS